MTPHNRRFAQYVYRHRQARGLSQRQLAEELGVTKPTISYWESAKSIPQVTILEPLARALGVSYEDLFIKAGYDPAATLPTGEPYLRLRYPRASKRRLAEAKRLFDALDPPKDKPAKRSTRRRP
jgi:transcriptional regulator with XRE-family HTH domain